MKLGSLFTDIATLNTTSFRRRWHKLVAAAKRTTMHRFREHYGNGRDLKQIPVIINNRNRLDCLLKLVEWLETNGLRNIYFIDNASTYPPLLQFYTQTKYPVFRLKENVGHLALWKSGLIEKFESDYYIYTDPDVVPVEECPGSVVEFFMEQLNRHKGIEKIGFGLKIDDLPDHYRDKQKVIDWETQFWEKEVEPDVFEAELDTTFALYRPHTNGEVWVQRAYRTGGKYVARHLPWYVNSSEPSEEDQYYKEHARIGTTNWV